MSRKEEDKGPRGPMGHGMRGMVKKPRILKEHKEIICLFKTLLF